MKQERVAIADLPALLEDKVSLTGLLKRLHDAL